MEGTENGSDDASNLPIQDGAEGLLNGDVNKITPTETMSGGDAPANGQESASS